MTRSRADEILEGWRMIAHSAERPMEAPRPHVYPSVIAGVLGTAAVATVLVVGLVVRGGGLGPLGPIPGGNVTASPSSTAASSPSPSAVTSPSASSPMPASPSPTGATASGTPTAAEVNAARQAADRYTADLVAGDYAAAWAMLAAEDRAAIGSLGAFTAERSAFFRSVAGRYVVIAQPTDVAPITEWLGSAHGATIDPRHAVLVEVTYPALAGNNAGYDLYIADQGLTGIQLHEVR